MAAVSFQEWFCLKDDRENFEIDPVRDQAHLFGEPEWTVQIDDILHTAEELKVPVRLVWWGDFGIGKTHRLRHTEYLIRTKAYRYHPCYVVATDLQEKTGFERLHRELVNSLGRDPMRELVRKYLRDADDRVPGVMSIQDLCGPWTDVASALLSFGDRQEAHALSAWRFLCGLKLEREELGLASVTKAQLDSSLEFATVLLALATIIKRQAGKQLLYLIDQGEVLKKVKKQAVVDSWIETLRAVLDVKALGVILAVGAERDEGIPEIVLTPEIVRRFQRDHYLQMPAYKAEQASKFVASLLQNWVDPVKRESLEAREHFTEKLHSEYQPDLYPFTKGAFERFCEWATVDPRNAKPSEIIARLNNVMAQAKRKERRLVTREHLTELGIS